MLIKVAREGTSHLTESMKAEIRQVCNHAMLWFVLFTAVLWLTNRFDISRNSTHNKKIFTKLGGKKWRCITTALTDRRVNKKQHGNQFTEKMVGNSRRAILSFRPFGGKYYMLVSSEQTLTRKSLFVCVAIVNKFISLSLLRRLVRFDMSTLIRT